MPLAALVTLGCPKNEADSDSFAGCLCSAGWTITDDIDDAHLLLLNTCAFIEPAVEEAVEAISQAIQWKKTLQGRMLILAGCLPGRYSDDGSGGLDDFDLIIGPGDTEALRMHMSVSGMTVPVAAAPGPFRYLKISEGCSNNCAYCTIPLIRGPHASRNFSEIERDAGLLVEQGAREIGIVGQDTGSYRWETTEVLHLLSILGNRYPDTWFRLYYIHPAHFPEGLLELMHECSNIMPYIDIPVQHASDSVLERMGRPYREEYLRGLFDSFERSSIQLALRTTVIVGYPGETEDDFKRLMDFLSDFRCIRNIAAFPYWPEEGTLEHSRLSDSELTPKEILQARMMRIGEISQEIHSSWAGRMDGMIIDVLADNHDTGHSRFDAPSVDGACIFQVRVTPGTFYRCRVVESMGADMIVEMAE